MATITQGSPAPTLAKIATCRADFTQRFGVPDTLTLHPATWQAVLAEAANLGPDSGVENEIASRRIDGLWVTLDPARPAGQVFFSGEIALAQ